MSTNSQVRELEVLSTAERSGVYVQYGCGFSAPAGWENFDASMTLRFERIPVLGLLSRKNAQRFPDSVMYGDIVRGLPIAKNSCRGVYASHVLEHLCQQDCLAALRNTFAMLQPGGRFRLLVPDLEVSIRQYMTEVWNSSNANHVFLSSVGLGSETLPANLIGKLYSALRTSAHQWMWDYPSMIVALENAGFTRIRRSSFGDSEDPMFRTVEDARRFEGAVAIEACK